MKKTIFFAVLAVMFAGFGLQTGTVHAQTADTAALKQQLDVAHATLVNLEMRAGMIPQGDTQIAESIPATSQPSQAAAVTVTTGLTESQIAYFDGVLTQLGTMLSELNTAIAANPTMDQAQLSAVASTLGTMKDTVSAITVQIAQDEQANASVAITSPLTPSQTAAPTAGTGSNASAPTVTAQATSSAPAGAAVTAAVNTANPAAATAQASSFWSFTKSNWPVLAIIVLVIAILAILFWPEKEAKAPVVKSSGAAPSSKPASVQPQTQAQAQGQVMNAAAPKMPPAASVDQGMKKPA